MPVSIVPYSLAWPSSFSEIEEHLKLLLDLDPPLSSSQTPLSYKIEHVGSTSIPNLTAKPVIDVVIVVPRSFVPRAISALTCSGLYIYIGEYGIPDRHAFRVARPDADRLPARNVYVGVEGCAAVRNMLGVRDVLRQDEVLREEYAAVKKGLVEKGVEIDEYVEGKSEVLQRVLAKAGTLTEEEREGIRSLNVSVEKGGILGSEK